MDINSIESQRIYAKKVVENIFELNSRKEYDNYFKEITEELEFANNIELSKFQKLVGWRILEEIYRGLDPTNIEKVSNAEEKTRQYLALYNPTKRDWKKTIERAVKNLLFSGSGNFDFFVDDFIGLRNIVKSWQSLGLGVYFSNIEKYALEKINHNHNPRKISNEEARIANIFDNYAKSPQLKKWLNSMRNPKLSTKQLKDRIQRIDNQKRATINGKHRRNHNLARFLKILNNYSCARCNKNNHNAKIEASHNIPLSVGINFGGVDRSWNITVLCHDCHKFEELIFRRKRNKIETEKELLEWLINKKNAKPEV